MNGIAAVIYRDYRQRLTNLGFVFWDVCVPVAYLTLFGLGFDRLLGDAVVIEGRSVGYTTFLLPGVLSMTAFTVAMNTAWGFFMDKDAGIFYELLTYPITRRQLLIGKACFNVLLSVLGALLAIVAGVAAMGVKVRWDLMPLTLLAMIFSTAGWFFLMSIFAISLRRMDAFNTITSAAYIFLMFLSTMFYPIDQLPAWFRWAAMVNPMTWQVDVLRACLLGVGSPSVIATEAAAFGVFALVCLGFAARALDRAH